MHRDCLPPYQHEHAFGQDRRRAGERRTQLVILLTATMMVVEIAGGLLFHSMALLADGLHMASHAVALLITAIAYRYARKRAHDRSFSFGTGKVNALGGYTGAVLLAVFAAFMAWESFHRFFEPLTIAFNQAILVAVVGLAVNIVSALILGVHDHAHEDDHTHHDHHEDHNLKAAYFHVLADAVTSLAAIFALLAGKYFGLNWMDPAMGIVGSILVARWSVGLLRQSGGVLLDRQVSEGKQEAIRKALEEGTTDKVSDLHVWSIGPGIYAAEIAIVTDTPRTPDAYKARLPADLHIVHATVEVWPCEH